MIAVGAKTTDIEVLKALREILRGRSLPQLKVSLATGLPFVRFPEAMDDFDYQRLEEVLDVLEKHGVDAMAYELDANDEPSSRNVIPVAHLRSSIATWRQIQADRKPMDAEEELDDDHGG